MMPYHIVIVPSEGPPEIQTFEKKKMVASLIKSLIGSPVNCFVFSGEKLFITSGPNRFLIEDGHLPMPLFAGPGSELTIDSLGQLGDTPTIDPHHAALTEEIKKEASDANGEHKPADELELKSAAGFDDDEVEPPLY